jgi:hypothetical protein
MDTSSVTIILPLLPFKFIFAAVLMSGDNDLHIVLGSLLEAAFLVGRIFQSNGWSGYPEVLCAGMSPSPFLALLGEIWPCGGLNG